MYEQRHKKYKIQEQKQQNTKTHTCGRSNDGTIVSEKRRRLTPSSQIAAAVRAASDACTRRRHSQQESQGLVWLLVKNSQK